MSLEAARCINEHTFPFSLKKGKFLMSPLEENSNLYFIVKGVIRGFIREEEKEITTWINEEREIVGSFHNIGMKLNTEEYLQALEDTVLIGIPAAMIAYLYTHYPETNIIGRIVLENYYRDAEERAYIGRVPSAHKKYSRFLETKPGLLNRIPLKYIASYLGMTLETLSRVRSRYRKAAK
ncbi:MAG: Crp/Fnr family transcriptional regulator [Adhaeribacter sp.]